MVGLFLTVWCPADSFAGNMSFSPALFMVTLKKLHYTRSDGDRERAMGVMLVRLIRYRFSGGKEIGVFDVQGK